MAEVQQQAPRARDWRLPLTTGVSVDLALPVARDAGHALEPALGYWGASAAGLAVAGAVGALVGLVVARLSRIGDRVKAR
jgi:hypothetical protein